MSKPCTFDSVADSGIAIRSAELEDATALRVLHRLALKLLASDHYSRQQIDSLVHHMPTLDLDLIEQGSYYVAECRDELVACGGWSGRPSGYGAVLDLGAAAVRRERGAALIRAMYTHPAWSRRGLAGRILRHAEAAAKARGFRRIELDALLPAVRLYSSSGYDVLAIVQRHLPDGQTLEIAQMGKALTPESSGVLNAAGVATDQARSVKRASVDAGP